MKEAIICDDILHVNMFHYFENPLYYMYTFLQNLSTMNILDLIFFISRCFYDFCQWPPGQLLFNLHIGWDIPLDLL